MVSPPLLKSNRRGQTTLIDVKGIGKPQPFKSTEAEWKPIQRVMRSRPTMQGSEEAEVNETVSAGVLFVQRPPDLRAEPPREEFVKGDDTHETKEACERICNVRARELSDQSMSFWKALRGVHEQGTHWCCDEEERWCCGDECVGYTREVCADAGINGVLGEEQGGDRL